MEEQKKDSKIVKMQPQVSTQGKEQNKLTYEQLKEMADKMFAENRYLRQQLQQATEYINTINRLDYLFKVVEVSHNNRSNEVSFATDFVEKCIDEIQKVMTPPEPKKEQPNEDTKED